MRRIAVLLVFLLMSSSAYATCGYVDLAIGNSAGLALQESDNKPFIWGDDINDFATNNPAVAFSSLDADENYACGIKLDGSLACWYAQGVGSDAFHVVSGVPAGTSYVEVSVGYGNACARKSDNTVVCWGDEASGGPWSGPSGTYTQFSGIQDCYCGVTTGGSVDCWGYGCSDTVGHEPSGTFTFAASFDSFACAVKSDYSIVCFGNDAGDHVIGYEPSGAFAAVSGSTGVSGGSAACGLDTYGGITCWGDGTPFVHPTPVVGVFTQLDAWIDDMCALDSGHNVVCWGDDGESVVASAPTGCTTTTMPPVASDIFVTLSQ
jgi:hypothetical protein